MSEYTPTEYRIHAEAIEADHVERIERGLTTSMRCVANLTNEELASMGLQRIKPRIHVTPSKREAD